MTGKLTLKSHCRNSVVSSEKEKGVVEVRSGEKNGLKCLVEKVRGYLRLKDHERAKGRNNNERQEKIKFK